MQLVPVPIAAALGIEILVKTWRIKINRNVLVSMAVKHNNVILNLITGCLYWLTTCFGQLYDHHQVYKS